MSVFTGGPYGRLADMLNTLSSLNIEIIIIIIIIVLGLYVPVNNFSVMSGRFPEFEPILSNEDEVSCSRTQHRAPGEVRTRDIGIKSPALYQLS